jgi:LmbE family N-acetylglucosaminyl deacetylase
MYFDHLREVGGFVIKGISPPKIEFFILILIFTISALFVSLSYLSADYGKKLDQIQFPEIKTSDRVLVIAAHPDDETLATGGMIQRIVEKHAQVLVVLMTNGDANSNSLNVGDVRHLETIRALEKLGVKENGLLFLSYPDRGVKNLFYENWDYDKLYKGMNGAKIAPYSFSFQKNAPYCGANVVMNLEQIMGNFDPTMIFYPDQSDNHPDHWATSAFVRYAAVETNYKGKQYTYLVHEFPEIDWPKPQGYSPNANLYSPTELYLSNAEWLNFPLTENEENLKGEAISCYRTQLDSGKTFLQSFIRKNEIFAIYPDIKIEKIKNVNSTSQMPTSSFNDLVWNLPDGGDVITVGLAFDKKDVNVYLKSEYNILGKFKHKIHLRLYDGKQFKRIDIEVYDGKGKYMLEARNSIKTNQSPLVQLKNNIMIVKIPKIFFKKIKIVLMSTDLFDARDIDVIDRTAWQILKNE